MLTPNPSLQLLPVKGILNARDLGGNIVRDGRTVRSGLLLRAAHLADATDADIQYLAGLPVTAIVDFRRKEEITDNADRTVPGAKYISLPVDPSRKVLDNASEKEKKKFRADKKFDVKRIIVMLAFNKKAQSVAMDLYPTLLFDPECQKQFATFFRLLLSTENGAILYHCTQGKDRTGIASALILSALGASRETIIADFNATNLVYEADVRKYTRRVKFWGGKEEEIAVVKSFLGANTTNFIKALDRVCAEFGSMEAYLKGPVGLNDSDLRTLRKRYLE